MGVVGVLSWSLMSTAGRFAATPGAVLRESGLHASDKRNVKRKPHKGKRPAARCPPTLVTDSTKLGEVLDELIRAKRFAFDTEFVMEDSYQADTCLIQVATDSMVALIDPLSGMDHSAFWELVADESVEKIVHSGAEDLALCVQQIGRIPRNIFDVQIAAGLVGLDYPLSLMKLVRATCKARLHKSQTLTDWRRRPLTDAQIQYARDDVAYLPAAYRTICRKLKKLGRMDWAREEFERFGRPEVYQRSEQSKVARLKGAGALDGRGLAVARELLSIREEMAKHFNRPARVMLKDYLIVQIARHQWTTPEQIRGLRGMQLSNAGVQRLAQAVERGMASAPETLPEVSACQVDTAEESALISLTTALVRAYCHEHEIAYQLAATKQEIRALVYSFSRGTPAEDSRLSGGWRGETVGRVLVAFFSGEQHVAIRRHGDSVRMVIEEPTPPQPPAPDG